MDDNFVKKLIEDLEKSGFGAEMRAIRVLLSNGWECSGSSYFMDKDIEKTREIDIVAHHWIKRQHADDDVTVSFFFIVAEVKKSEKPWVVFTSKLDKDRFWIGCAWNNLAKVNCRNEFHKEITEVLPNYSLLTESDSIAYGIHESFKPPSDSSRWYSAFVNVSKAAESELELNSSFFAETEKVSENAKFREFLFVQPVVILDGLLLSAELGTAGDIRLTEINEVPTQFRFQNNNYKRHHYRVDLVRLTHLDKYLERCKKRQACVVERIHELYKPEAD